ncbi:MAG: MinD/ParA family protein [Pseudomonadales bacterium]|jgi:flagellar biosynthesis protein FlhG
MSDVNPVRVIAVSGGKGGIGKTNVSVNLSIALAKLGRRVVLLDADLGLANVDVLLGIEADKTLAEVLSGECSLLDIMVEGPEGIKIVPAASGIRSMVELGDAEHAGLIQAFSDIDDQLDVLVIDTAAGISGSVTHFVQAAQEVLIVVCDEPTSITDAYALIKVLNRDYGIFKFNVVANMTQSHDEALKMFRNLSAVADKFLNVALRFAGEIPYDDMLRKAVKKREPVIKAYPRSSSALAFRELAKQVDTWPLPRSPKGHLEFFVERLIRSEQAVGVQEV